MVAEFGRSVTVIRDSLVAGDPAAPWDGPSDGTETEVPATAVFVSAGELGHLVEGDDTLKNATKIALIAAAETDPAKLEEFQRIDDGGELWRMTKVNTLQPGDTRILYIIALETVV